jgi:hypothetical protein
MSAEASTYRGKRLVIRRDRTVIYGGVEIGSVYPDPAASQIQRDWCYEHVSGTTLTGLHPDWPAERKVQAALTKRHAAQALADLHRKVEDGKPGSGGRAARRAEWVAGQIRLGRIPCPDPGGLAGRLGDTAWTEALEWAHLSGGRIRDQYGVAAGYEGTAARLTVRKARRNYICSTASCQHLILAGTLHGAELYYEHYCPCCVVLQCPPTRFTAEWPPPSS